jgi:predicted HTH domain antitoxin
MSTVSMSLPDSVVAAFTEPDKEVGRSILAAAVVKWYELGKISQGKGAELLGVSRSEFLDLLSSYRVSVWQYTQSDLDKEMSFDR